METGFTPFKRHFWSTTVFSVDSAVGLIKEGHAKTDDQIREGMSGNICRCGAYSNIVDAVKEAMRKS